MARRILDVFLSSTARDLEPHRAAIHAELTSTGLFLCVRQEDFGAQNAEAIEYCREKVKASDIFIGLTGQRRGWEPDGDSARRSITEMEHDWAKEAGRRRYLYVAPDNFPVPGDLRDTDEQYARQQAFRKRVMDGGERVVSQKGFEYPERFAADIVKYLLTQLVTGDLITLLRPELSTQSPGSPDEQRPAIAAAVGRLAEDEDVDLLALAKNPKNADLAELERKLTQHAERHETEGQTALKTSAEYWRHIGALAFLHNTKKAFIAYEKAVALDPLEPDGWRYLGELQHRLGDLANAEQSFDRILALGKSSCDLKTQAIGCLRLGRISVNRGDLTRAEEFFADALRLAESAQWREGMARGCGNLGIIHWIRGDLTKAEEMYLKSLELEEELGSKAGMARAHGNLGMIHQTRGDLDTAEEIQRKALALNDELGDRDGIAAAYVHLGIIYRTRGNLAEAEEMQRKALTLYEELGSKEGMALSYYNTGTLHRARGDLDKAEEMYRKSLTLEEELGNKEHMASTYGSLGVIHAIRGDFSQAEEMQRRALTLNEELGSKLGMVIVYENFGLICQRKGDKAMMYEYWRKVRDLCREMGLSDKVAEVEKWLKLNEYGDS